MSDGAGIAGRIAIARDRFTLDVDFALQPGERVGVIGANGSGKSTLVAALAGLVPLTKESTVARGNQPWRLIPVEERGIGFIAQDGLLFPHLNVLDNVAFGPRSAGKSRPESRAIAARMLEEVHAGHLASASATSVSGGERQRIALARALATDPRILVLDEPFAALDVDAAVEVREIMAQQVHDRQLSLVLVTHDLVDAVRLTDRLIVLEAGRIVETLATRELLRSPASTFAASFAGLARLEGTLERDGFHAKSGVRVPLAGVEIDPTVVLGEDALLLATPDHVEVAADLAVTNAAVFEDVVESLIGDGAAVLVKLRSGLRARWQSEDLPTAGLEVRVRLRVGRIRPAHTE